MRRQIPTWRRRTPGLPLTTIKTYEHMDRVIVANLHKIRMIPFDVIVYMPRSGMAPAGMIATYLARPVATVEEYCAGMIWTRKAINYDAKCERILLIDDHVNRGKQMMPIIEKIKQAKPNTQIKTLAIYSSGRDKLYRPDYVLDDAGVQYLYPWFMWKSNFALNPCALDMDGVLCRDATREEDDDGENYLQFLTNVEPKLLPHAEAKVTIITSRIEKYRAQTEEWLRKHGVTVARLIMGPWRSKEERRGKADAWKAEEYLKSGSILFVESNDKSAQKIAELSKKTVYCIDSSRVYGGA